MSARPCYRAPILYGAGPDDVDWDKVPGAAVAHYMWETEPFRPDTVARLALLDSGLAVLMASAEPGPRITVTGHGGDVYEDSCLEFFFQPTPETDARYLNFEINPAGALLLEVGPPGRRFRLPPQDGWRMFGIRAEVGAGGWQVRWQIPHGFIREHFPHYRPGAPMRGNFYKCGNLCPVPHYGCWAPVDPAEVNFHRPDRFGTIAFTP